ncbi:MAG: NAD(P)-binding protein [Alphaproteobacteria bacterium]|nr:NAD(P)-binding protein [Alphaproteobacteria bacterium]
MGRAHVVGAGMAGLAAALRLSGLGHAVTLYEGAGQAGGRCRSFHDETLDCVIDNGNHLMLAGNTAIAALLAETGAAESLPAAEAVIPFIDLASGERWSIRPNAGRLPWWIFARDRRTAGSSAWDYLSALRLAWAGDATVQELLGGNAAFFRRFWRPLAIAILNTPPETAAARLLWPVMVEIFGRGGDACRPRFARESLSRSLVDPALDTLRRRGADIHFNRRLRQIGMDGGRAHSLDFGGESTQLENGDAVVLALSAPSAAALLPSIAVPEQFHPIVNVHYRLGDAASDAAGDAASGPGRTVMLGIVGGTAEWVFARGPVVSVTISAADAIVDRDAEAIAQAAWADVAKAMELPGGLPAYRVIKEKRATFAQTPAAERRRPPAATHLRNLFLAGDWTSTGLPATIEGAVRSGFTAADAASALLEC